MEQRVKARNHHEAQRMLEEAGMGEVVILDRETRADHVVNRRVRGIGVEWADRAARDPCKGRKAFYQPSFLVEIMTKQPSFLA